MHRHTYLQTKRFSYTVQIFLPSVLQTLLRPATATSGSTLTCVHDNCERQPLRQGVYLQRTVSKAAMAKYFIREIYALMRYLAYVYVDPSKDFRLAFIVIVKFKFSQGSLKNAKHQFSNIFYFITRPNVNGLKVMLYYFKGIDEGLPISYREPKSLAFGRTGLLNLFVCADHRPHVSQNTWSVTLSGPFCGSPTKGKAL